MLQNRNTVLGWLGISEGGYVNHPKDPGGATNHGVTQKTLTAWRKSKGLGPLNVKLISKKDADDIFMDNYFRPVWFDQLPSGLDYAMVDYAINSGPSRAIRALQGIVGAKVDGVLGVHTMASVNNLNPAMLIIELCEQRLNFMRRLKHWPTFKNGWTTRVMGNKMGAQDDDIGVIDRGVRLARDATGIPAPQASKGKAIPQGGLAELIKTIIAALMGGLK